MGVARGRVSCVSFDVRAATLFTLVACSSPSPHRQLAAPAPPAAPDAGATPDTPTALGALGALGGLGDSCRTVACTTGLTCDRRVPGGYCTSACGPSCTGACIESSEGQICAKPCVQDSDCRGDEGYVCQRGLMTPVCIVPNFAPPAMKSCTGSTPARDAAFGESEVLAVDTSPQRGASAVLVDDGTIVARADARLARRGPALFAVTDGPRIDLATSTDRGATWSTPVAVHDPGDCAEQGASCLEHANVVAGKDRVFVLYGAGTNGLRVRTSRDGTTFTTGPLALIGSYGNAVVTSDGKLHVMAMNGSALGAFGSAMQRIEYAMSSDGGETFTAPSPVSGGEDVLAYNASNPSLAVDDRRKLIYAAYTLGGRYDAWQIMLAVSKDGGATWKRSRLTTSNCAMHLLPNLVVDPATGTLHVAYYDTEGAPGRFVHATCGIGATKCKVAGAINTTPFAGLSLSRGASTWPGDYASLVVDGKRRALHAVWLQPVAEGSNTVVRLMHAVAKLKK